MDKKGKTIDFFHRLESIKKTVKSTYLYKMVSKFVSVACTIILVLLLIVGALMFYFNMKSKSYEDKGIEYTSPFGLYTIISGSMEPNVSVYDVVISVDEDISKIKVGDIITFISTWDFNFGVTVTHRVVEISKNANGEYQLTTKGDNNQSKDGGVVTQKNLIGKVVGRLPQLGRLQYFLATKMGWFLIVFIPAIIIIIVDVIKIFKLYVLKDQIEKVKTRKEALAAALGETIDDSSKTKESSKEEAIHPTIETVVPDTVSEQTALLGLPIIDVDGKIKENTLELPTVKQERETEVLPPFETIAVDVNDLPKEEIEIPIVTKEIVELPITKEEYELPNSVETTEKTESSAPMIPDIPRIKESNKTELPIAIKKADNPPINRAPIQRNKLKRR